MCNIKKLLKKIKSVITDKDISFTAIERIILYYS